MEGYETDNQLAIALSELTSKIQMLLDKQEELAENITKIKEAVYNPDEGLYARLKELEMRLLALESWKGNNSKALWIIITVSVGVFATALWQAIF